MSKGRSNVWKLRSILDFSDPEFGGKGDGATDNTAAWAAIVAAANAQISAAVLAGRPIATAKIKIPPGDYLINTGATVVNCNLEIEGDGSSDVRIRIGAGQYLLTATATIFTFKLRGIQTSGGKGVLRHTLATVNVQGHFVVEDNEFFDYTECALGTLCPDFPYWKINRNTFHGSSALTSKGVVLAADGSGSCITNNAFSRNKYHIKLARAGVAVKIHDNDFIRFTDGGGAPALTDIWIVPSVNVFDTGLAITVNKFGNENKNAADYTVLIADEAAGTDAMTKDHATTASTGYAAGVTMRDNDIVGAGTPTKGVVYSYTPNILGWCIDDQYRGSKYPYVLHYDAAVTVDADRSIDCNYIRLWRGSEAVEAGPRSEYSNAPSVAYVDDKAVITAGYDSTRTQHPVGFDPSFSDLWTTGTSGARLLGLVNATRTNVTDSLGDDDAAEYTFSTVAGFAYGYLAAPTVNRLAWLEFDLKRAAAQSVTRLMMDIRYDASVKIPLRRIINLPTNWQRIRIPWVPRTASAAQHVEFRVADAADYSAGVTDRFQVGRIKLYHAAEPIHFGSRYLQAKAVYDPPSLNDGAGTTTTVAVSGAVLGDFAEASFSLDTQGITITAWVSAADTVSVRLQNESGGVLDILSGTLRVRVRKKDA